MKNLDLDRLQVSKVVDFEINQNRAERCFSRGHEKWCPFRDRRRDGSRAGGWGWTVNVIFVKRKILKQVSEVHVGEFRIGVCLILLEKIMEGGIRKGRMGGRD